MRGQAGAHPRVTGVLVDGDSGAGRMRGEDAGRGQVLSCEPEARRPGAREAGASPAHAGPHTLPQPPRGAPACGGALGPQSQSCSVPDQEEGAKLRSQKRKRRARVAGGRQPSRCQELLFQGHQVPSYKQLSWREHSSPHCAARRARPPAGL